MGCCILAAIIMGQCIALWKRLRNATPSTDIAAAAQWTLASNDVVPLPPPRGRAWAPRFAVVGIAMMAELGAAGAGVYLVANHWQHLKALATGETLGSSPICKSGHGPSTQFAARTRQITFVK